MMITGNINTEAEVMDDISNAAPAISELISAYESFIMLFVTKNVTILIITA